MARTKAIVIEVKPGHCRCGCGTAVARNYAQGHDAKLRGKLAAAAREGTPVAIVADGIKTTKPAAAWLGEHGWPVPAPAQAKPKAGAREAKPRGSKEEAAPAVA